jgi:hypothetical protein
MKKGLKQSSSKKNSPSSSNSKNKSKKDNSFTDYIIPKTAASSRPTLNGNSRINKYDVIFGYWKEYNEYMKNIKEEDLDELKDLEEENLLGFKQFVMV